LIGVAALALGFAATGASGAAASTPAPAPGPVAAHAPVAAAASVVDPVAVVPAGVDDFRFALFDADYELSRDDGDHSTLRTVETLVAVFPEYDQNRGIRRAIPTHYDGHPTDIDVVSVTDAAGTPRGYETETSEDGEFLLVTIAADDFVHGEQTYVITYDQRNVTLAPTDLRVEEFYWDVNGTGWLQTFDTVRAELHLDEALAAAFTGDAACYRGYEGSTAACDSLVIRQGSDPVLTAEAATIGPYETLTFAAAFPVGTFEPRDERFISSPAAIAGAVGALIALGAALAALVLRFTAWRDHPGRGVIVAQYEPPEGVSVLESADLVNAAGRGVTATILQEAVAGSLRIVETGRRKYAVEYVAPDPTADADTDSVVAALFTRTPVSGQRRDLKSRDTALGTKLVSLRTKVHSRMARTGFRHKPGLGLRVLLGFAAIVGGTIAVLFSIFALDQQMGGGWPYLVMFGGAGVGLVGLLAVSGVRPLTERGRAARDHLEGLREYIRLAEADRLRVLQSPSGALRVERPALGAPRIADAAGAAPVATAPLDAATVLKLNERLLPYAVLFGQEREWSEELAALYAARGETPTWYSGRDGFNAVAFSSGVDSFTSASSASWSGSSSSSSSGGSGGGGSSGGGGGGGGGGGV
jgi:uncharacterized membrane protein YgcG